MPRQLDLNDVRLLMQVVEHGSYTAASQATGIPKSTISQRITALERAIGTGLLRRTSRSFSLTEAGAELLPHARAIEGLARQVETALFDRGDEVQGTLRLSCSNALAQFALSPLVPRFLAQHSKVNVKIEASNRTVDLIAEGYDMTIRGHVGPLKDSTLRQRVVGRTQWSVVAAPDWIAQHGMPESPADIPAGEVLCFSLSQECPTWSLVRDGEVVNLSFSPRLVSNDMATLKSAAIAGGGVTCLPAYILQAGVSSGQLMSLLPGWRAQESMISVLTPPRAQSSRLAGAFSNFLAAELPRVMQTV